MPVPTERASKVPYNPLAEVPFEPKPLPRTVSGPFRDHTDEEFQRRWNIKMMRAWARRLGVEHGYKKFFLAIMHDISLRLVLVLKGVLH